MKVYVVNYMVHSHSENHFQVHESELNARLHYMEIVDEEKKRLRKYKDTIKVYDAPEEKIFNDFRCYRTNCDDDVRVSLTVVETDGDFSTKNPFRTMTHCW